MIKNRNIKNKLCITSSDYKSLEIITDGRKASNITSNPSTSTNIKKSTEDNLELTCDTPDIEEFFNRRSCSSSSSVSWAEDVDDETTRRVQRVFERMERVLQGLEGVPEGWDKDEYELWMKTFHMVVRPNIRKLGWKSEIQVIKDDYSCDRRTSTANVYKDNESLQKNVIRQHKPTNRKPKRKQEKSKTNTLLRITTPLNAELTAKDIAFTSLPHLEVKGRKSSISVGKQRCLVSEQKVASQVPHLPPIAPSKVRSVSATPRNTGKSIRVNL